MRGNEEDLGGTTAAEVNDGGWDVYSGYGEGIEKFLAL